LEIAQIVLQLCYNRMRSRQRRFGLIKGAHHYFVTNKVKRTPEQRLAQCRAYDRQAYSRRKAEKQVAAGRECDGEAEATSPGTGEAVAAVPASSSPEDEAAVYSE
jgi:hypothetical protein